MITTYMINAISMIERYTDTMIHADVHIYISIHIHICYVIHLPLVIPFSV